MKIFTHYDTTNIEAKGWTISSDDSGSYTFVKKTPYQYFTLRRFTGDCGTLTLHNVGNITREALAIVKDIASQSGHDTVICTYLHIDGSLVQPERVTVENFRKERWIAAVKGKSNRKYHCKTNQKIVYILHLRNCKHKGY